MHFSTTLDENLSRQYAYSSLGEARSNSLLHRERADVSDECSDERLGEPGVVQVENVLDDIVSERILDEVERVEDDLGDQLDALGGASVVDGSLKNAASVSVGRDFDEVGGNSVVDELVVLRDELVQALLDDLRGSV
jgi:outer membrane receptor protein involved in Fe transport